MQQLLVKSNNQTISLVVHMRLERVETWSLFLLFFLRLTRNSGSVAIQLSQILLMSGI